MAPQETSTRMRQICAMAPVIPVLVVDTAGDAEPLATALVAGGLPVLEVTLRTGCALNAISRMARVPGAIVGAGTLLTPEDVSAAKSAGASFGVSPGATPALLEAALANSLPLLPGASSASEVMALLARGYDILKFFPAKAAGGTTMLKSLAGPFPQVSFCPTGGISPSNKDDYLALENVLCVGGSWLTQTSVSGAEKWTVVTQLARQASGCVG